MTKVRGLREWYQDQVLASEQARFSRGGACGGCQLHVSFLKDRAITCVLRPVATAPSAADRGSSRLSHRRSGGCELSAEGTGIKAKL